MRTVTDLDLRLAVLRMGIWIGWISIGVVVVGLTLRAIPTHLWLLLSLIAIAATGNELARRVQWRNRLAAKSGELLLDLWSGALIAFVAALVLLDGSSFSLLLFLALPFVAVAHSGRRRAFWLAVSLFTCVLVATSLSLPVAATVMRLSLVAAVVAFAVLLAGSMGQAAARAELDRTLVSEAHHRIKNSLQAVADLLLLARPDGEERQAFDESAMRIRSIAAVHRLLSEHDGAPVLAESLLESIAAGTPYEVSVQADRVVLEPESAQRLGMVANELLANALQHGTAPIAVRLSREPELRLTVEDSGSAAAVDRAGLGLELVRRLVEQGLGGRFELSRRRGGRTRAEVVIPAATQ